MACYYRGLADVVRIQCDDETRNSVREFDLFPLTSSRNCPYSQFVPAQFPSTLRPHDGDNTVNTPMTSNITCILGRSTRKKLLVGGAAFLKWAALAGIISMKVIEITQLPDGDGHVSCISS